MVDPIEDGEVAHNYVAGEWREASGDESLDVENPATGDRLGSIAFSSADDEDEAVALANEAFEEWSTTAVEERIQPLFRFKQLLEDHQESLAEVLVTEHGKTKAEAMGEIRRGIENVEVACGIPTMMQAGHLPHAAPNIDETAVRQPLGTVVAVTPFNFPAMIPLWFLPYAVATGNTFVLKPSERDPFTANRIASLVDEAGFPDGVVNVVHGGPDTVNRLITHDGIEAVSFVGSTPIAQHVYETAAGAGKRVQAQGGAKNHVIVSANADLQFAAEQTCSSAFANAGQRCLANPVAVVEDEVYDEFAELLVEEAKAMEVGPGLEEGTDMGPLVSGPHRDSVLEYVETGVEEGAELLLDGREQAVPEAGYHLGASVFGDVDPDATIAREEIFGPVLALIRAEDFDDAVSLVNRSQFGNAASLFTSDGGEARQFRLEVDAGNVGVNVGTAAAMAFFHFGGDKDSFFGDLHAQGDDAVRFYTDETVYIERWPDN
ncbi:CoA-acylating methylmalonate-semialdehyde dehydrogenase [Halobaculum rubrum]|uniref:CoA-acylating methylmalonate-semialdehyde dehydrogenase n=1 Tax=Halobaculum rubrum TaxID=2872158 RepID=UPI001CA4558D|nr:CoA-acylating methylmalonate-semialdehyde dehydrogenase [Halobaculum rubrum]QZX99341.1 CoA-acylating methylmalonate-semialdehyde dehydrogenase [Halobaculum rubrum]